MSVPCPTADELTRLLDGELTENRAAQVRAHAAACPPCAAELRAQEALLSAVAAPVPGLPSPGALAAVLRRLDDAPAPRAVAARRLGPPAWASLAAAAAAVLVVVGTTAPPRRPDGFAARGGQLAFARQVGVELWALEAQPRRLAPGDQLAAGVPVVASYSNAGAAPAFLLAFALDEQGEAHWLYPGFLDPGGDPEALRLDGAVARRALAESVVLEEVPAGALRLVTVVSARPLHVSAIEAAGPGERTAEALRRRWPDARVEELAVRYGGAVPGGRP